MKNPEEVSFRIIGVAAMTPNTSQLLGKLGAMATALLRLRSARGSIVTPRLRRDHFCDQSDKSTASCTNIGRICWRFPPTQLSRTSLKIYLHSNTSKRSSWQKQFTAEVGELAFECLIRPKSSNQYLRSKFGVAIYSLSIYGYFKY